MEPPQLELLVELGSIEIRRNPFLVPSPLDPVGNYSGTMLGIKLRDLVIVLFHLKCCPSMDECIEAFVNGC